MVNGTKNVYWLIQADIRDGRRDELAALMARMVALTEANEPGVLAYEWWIGEDGGGLFIFERYADSDAALAHLANIGAALGEFMSMVTFTAPLVIFGEASAALREAFAGLGPSYVARFGGFAR